MKVLYSIGDSFVFRGPNYTTWSNFLSDKLGWIDANNGMSGTSNDRSYRSVVRDITRVETDGKLWTELTDDIDCNLEDLFVHFRYYPNYSLRIQSEVLIADLIYISLGYLVISNTDYDTNFTINIE